MKTQWMTITPEQAAEWLKTLNTRNRSISQRKVAIYASDMRKGNWRATHQGIGFYEDGTLSDGQHRLAACVESGVPLDVFVTFGIPGVSAAGIDAHRPRSTADQVRIAGMSEWINKDSLAVAKVLGAMCGNPVMSTHDAVELLERNRWPVECALSAMPKKQRFISIAPVYAAMACAWPHVGGEVIERFGRVMQSGIQEALDDVAAIRLREKLLMGPAGFSHGGSGRVECVKASMRAIKAFTERARISKLYTPSEFIYPALT